MRKIGMFIVGALAVAVCSPFIIVGAQEKGAPQLRVKLAPFVMETGAKLSGDHICRNFLLTHYGNINSPAWIGFAYEKGASKASESVLEKNLRVTTEDTPDPYATMTQDGTAVAWTIHINPNDTGNLECLAGVPRN